MTSRISEAPPGAPRPPDAAGADALAAEIVSLRARVAEAEDLAAQAADEARRLREQQHVLRSVVDNAPAIVFVKDRDGRCTLVNQSFEQLMGVPREQILGKLDNEIFPEDVAKQVHAMDVEIMAADAPRHFEEQLIIRGVPRDFFTLKFPIHDARGEVSGVGGITTDITERKREDAERTALREQVIAAQQTALRELSTPLIPIADGILAMPLVGSVDATRAAHILEALLGGVSAHGAHTAILDITGVHAVGAEVAAALVGAARAVRLLGARVVLTGIRAEVAQTLVALDVDLDGIVTLGTLQSGIAYALRRA